MSDRRWRPAFGYALIRRGEPGLTEGGIALPDTSDDDALYIVVESSEGHIENGVRVPSTLRKGDRLLLEPRPYSARDQRGQVTQGMAIRLRRVSIMPEHMYFVHLRDVYAVGRLEPEAVGNA